MGNEDDIENEAMDIVDDPTEAEQQDKQDIDGDADGAAAYVAADDSQQQKQQEGGAPQEAAVVDAPSSSSYVWSAFHDDDGTLYYFNRATQETAWEPPPNGEGFNPPPPAAAAPPQEEPAAAPPPPGAAEQQKEGQEDENDDEGDDDDDYVDGAAAEAQEKRETAAEDTTTGTTTTGTKWVRYVGNEGEYFYNVETQETQWEAPEEGFIDAEEEQGEGNDVVQEAEQEKTNEEVVQRNDDENEQTPPAADENAIPNVDMTDFDRNNDSNVQAKPSDVAEKEEEEEPGSTATTPAAASKWVRYSGNEGDYFYNMDTQATQWEAPMEGFMEADEYEAATATAAATVTTSSDERGDNDQGPTATAPTTARDDEDDATATSAADAAVASNWVRYKDDEGSDYFFNTETGATQWDMPEGFVASSAVVAEAAEAAVAAASANEQPDQMDVDNVSDEKAGPRDDQQNDQRQQKLGTSMENPTADDGDDKQPAAPVLPKEEEEEDEEVMVEEEIDPAVKCLQEAEDALNKPDSIFEPTCFDNVTEVVSSQGGNPQKALTALLDNYQGQTAICGLLALWLANLKSSDDTTANALMVTAAGNATLTPATSAAAAAAAATGSSEAMAEEIRTTVQDVINRTAKQRFSKEAGDSILNLSRQKAAFLEDMMESTRWRKLLIDLSASHKDSALLKYCLGSIADRGHHREIAKRINQADHFTVFRQMLQSELAAIGKLAVSAGTDPVTSIGMDELVNDLKRACTATSYTYLYSLQVLRALESKARKELQELERESEDPNTVRLRRAARKWEVFCQLLENSMVDPAAAMAGSSTVFHKRRLDVALTINELTQRQRKRQRPGDDGDIDNGMNGHDERSQSALESALLRFLRRYALGVQVDDSLLDPLLPSGLDTVHAGKQIGALLMKHSLSVRALLGYLYKPGLTRVTAPVVKNKCARLIALSVRAAEEVAWAEYKAPKIKGGEDGELGDNDDGASSRELSDEVALTRVILQGSQLCEQLESMVSFLVSVDKIQKDKNGSGVPSGPGQKLCSLAFQHAPVAQGVMIWAREFTHGNEFATSASFPTLSVSILSLTRLVGINQPFARADALAIALQFLKHTNRDVSYQKMNAIKEQSLRLLIHLLMQGEVAAVLNAITSRLQQQSSSELDASLIRYFVAGVLEAVRPPISCAFVRLFAQLLLAPLCIDAVRSTYFQTEHRARLIHLVLAFPKARTVNRKTLQGEDLAIVNSLMATYQIKPE